MTQFVVDTVKQWFDKQKEIKHKMESNKKEHIKFQNQEIDPKLVKYDDDEASKAPRIFIK